MHRIQRIHRLLKHPGRQQDETDLYFRVVDTGRIMGLVRICLKFPRIDECRVVDEGFILFIQFAIKLETFCRIAVNKLPSVFLNTFQLCLDKGFFVGDRFIEPNEKAVAIR